MRCPACEHPIEETTALCASCGFNLSQADAHFGATLQAKPRLTDLQSHLSRSGRIAVLKATLEFEQRFPNIAFTTLIHVPSSNFPTRPYLIWLFNRSGLHSALQKGGSNRHILLWINPDTCQLSVVLGYGLEPLVPDSLIQEALTAANPPAKSDQHANAAVAFIRQLDVGLAKLQSELPRIFGWFPHGTWRSLEDDFDTEEDDFADDVLTY